MNSILEVLAADQYRMGDCQAIGYDAREVKLSSLPKDYLHHLWLKLQGDRFNRRGEGNGFLRTLMCGMSDLSYPAMISYLGTRPLIIVGVWHDDETFEEAGIGFPTVITTGKNGSSCFYGYGIFPSFWGDPRAETLGMLGLALTFHALNYSVLRGIRYSTNDLTSRWSSRFGFRDLCELPMYLLHNGDLVSAVASQLMREDFEKYVQRKLVDAYRDGIQEPAKPDTPSEADQRILSLFE